VTECDKPTRNSWCGRGCTAVPAGAEGVSEVAGTKMTNIQIMPREGGRGMDDSTMGSITHWIGVLKGGDGRAAAPLFERYYERIVALARARLRGAGGPIADEEDAAVSVFVDLFVGAPLGKFPLLDDRDDLWGLLAVITARKAADLKKRQGRRKRGGNRIVHACDLDDEGRAGVMEQAAGREPIAEFTVMMAEECQRRIDALKDDVLRDVAMLRLEGFSDGEIAERLGCSRRTVMRKVKLIRLAWSPRDGEEHAA
jgi:DNA-directed RNA polymerase specialized sigma24 family protein